MSASRISLLCLVFFIITVTSCLPQHSIKKEKTNFEDPIHTPENSPEDSISKHFQTFHTFREKPSAGDISLISIKETFKEYCDSCHDQYNKNHHPVDIVFSNPDNIPFPLFDGKVKCLTCHVENHEDPTPNLLRGGPSGDRRDICFQCHYKEQYSEIDPHYMLNKDGGIREERGKPVCLLCHAKIPDVHVDRASNVLLRADIAFLCWRCHAPMINPIFDQHFLNKPSKNMLRNIEINEQQMQVTIPLVPRGRITCSTCHNPHQKGVIIYEPSAKGADSQHRLRLRAPTLCFACHRI